MRFVAPLKYVRCIIHPTCHDITPHMPWCHTWRHTPHAMPYPTHNDITPPNTTGHSSCTMTSSVSIRCTLSLMHKWRMCTSGLALMGSCGEQEQLKANLHGLKLQKLVWENRPSRTLGRTWDHYAWCIHSTQSRNLHNLKVLCCAFWESGNCVTILRLHNFC